ncbi:hypothetical protein [Aeribacillus pallidus]|uniref:hypothetical protein n=1 Tax=Aeribacillus pallidus TaxID=33936 RepID=UPI003D1A4BEA
MADGYWWRKDELGELLAHFTAIIAKPHYKKRNLKGSDLYRRRDRKVVSLEERQKRFERAVKLMGPDAIPVKRKVKKKHA